MTNMWILAINIMYAGETWELPRLQPSRAQQRAQVGFLHRARHFLRQLSARSPGGEEIKSFTRLGSHEYGGAKTAAVPLGTRAGVPQRAAVVDTAAALEVHYPGLARQCRDSEALLKLRSDWPEKPVKTFARLDATYPLLVDEGVRVGMLELAPEEQLEHLGGLPISGGAFAVPKDEKEDRWISPNETVNMLVDDKKMIKVEMPYLPQLRGVTEPRGNGCAPRGATPGTTFTCCVLASVGGASWRSPPRARRARSSTYPVQCGWPMGFRGSAVIAQAVTESSAKRGRLPEARRCVPHQPCPLAPPLWGTIIDDLWVLHTDEPTEENEAAQMWAQSVEDEWARIGVESHPNKRVDAEEGHGGAGRLRRRGEPLAALVLGEDGGADEGDAAPVLPVEAQSPLRRALCGQAGTRTLFPGVFASGDVARALVATRWARTTAAKAHRGHPGHQGRLPGCAHAAAGRDPHR